MLAEFYDAIRRCNEDAGIGAIVFTGAGRGFCSGADIGGFAGAINAREQGDEDAARRRVADRAGRESLSAYFRKAKPIIAAINGAAIGVSLTMTLNMDLRIASESARFSMRFVRLGITPEAGSTLYSAEIVGLPNALELALTGRIIDAQEALAKGPSRRSAPDPELMPAALALAEEIAFNPTEQVLAAKQMIHRHMVEQDIDHLLTYEQQDLRQGDRRPQPQGGHPRLRRKARAKLPSGAVGAALLATHFRAPLVPACSRLPVRGPRFRGRFPRPPVLTADPNTARPWPLTRLRAPSCSFVD